MEMAARAEVPFAEHSRGITVDLQDLWKGDHCRIQAAALVVGDRCACGVELKTEPLLITPRYQSRARWTACAGCDVGIRESHTALGQGVNVRGGDCFRAINAGVGIAQVISKKQDNIGWSLDLPEQGALGLHVYFTWRNDLIVGCA